MPLTREPYGFLDAALRHDRARKHLTDLKRLIDIFEATPQEIGERIEPETIEELVASGHRDLRRVPIPYDIPIIVGEVVYNLRSALDYLIFALAWHDTGREPSEQWARRLQFPIESKPEVFEGRRKTFLKGISDPHVAMIREYQPAHGCTWTEVLVTLSDKDKHRHLTVIGAAFDRLTGTWFSDSSPNPDAVPDSEGRYAMDDMDMDAYATLAVVFPDGRLVTETLQELESEVRALLLRFGPEFTLRPV